MIFSLYSNLMFILYSNILFLINKNSMIEIFETLKSNSKMSNIPLILYTL